MSYSPRTPRVIARRHRAAAVLAALMLGAAVTGGCSSEGNGATTECSVNAECTVTFDRSTTDAKATILGIEVKLEGVDGDNVTLSVAGVKVTAPVNEPTQAGEFEVTVEKVTDAEVVVKIARAGG